MKNEDNIKKTLIALLTLFDGKPNLLSEFLIKNNLITDKLKSLLNSNKNLEELYNEISENGEIEKPYFSNLDEMDKFYSKFFIIEKNKKIIKSETQEEKLKNDILNALKSEDYKKASQIRDYCKKNNIDLEKFFN